MSDIARKTPLLGSIPLIKWLFNNKDKSTQEVELMLFLRPRVIRSPDDAKQVMHDVELEAPLVKKWQDENILNKSKLKTKK